MCLYKPAKYLHPLHTCRQCSVIQFLTFIHPVCPVNTQNFFLRSGDASVTVAATSEDAANNPATGFVDANTPVWCTAEGEGIPERRNYIDLTFSETVVIEFIESTGLLESWVSNFSIQYSTSASGDDFMPYGVLETSQV